MYKTSNMKCELGGNLESGQMCKVHVRGPDEKMEINLNGDGKAVFHDQSIITDLSNFLGTLVNDNVFFTYVKWHVVLKQLKNQMSEYMLVNSNNLYHSSSLPILYFYH